MANESPSSFFSSVTPQQVMALVALFSSTVLLQYEPLQTRREVEQVPPSLNADDHKFSASNVEDPLAAVKATDILHPDVGKDFDVRKQVKAYTHWGFFENLNARQTRARRDSPGEARPVQLVLAYLRSGEDMPAREQRERCRLAVLYGLASCGYVPEASRSMQCLRIAPPTAKMQEKHGVVLAGWKLGDNSMDIPFEWFKSEKNPSNKGRQRFREVCVLWIDSDAFTQRLIKQKPMEHARAFLHAVLTGHPRPNNEAAARLQPMSPDAVEITILGPYSTDRLSAFVREGWDRRKSVVETVTAPTEGSFDVARWEMVQLSPSGDDMPQWAGPLWMVSPYATASAKGILHLAGVEADRQDPDFLLNDILKNQLRNQDPNAFLRVSAPDDYVADALRGELFRRGVDIMVPKDNEPAGDVHDPSAGDIVLISEMDTGYGRELPFNFCDHDQNGLSRFNQPGSRWHWVSFVRGLDGRFSAADSGSGKGPGKESGSQGSGRSSLEEPRGIQQMDALRRLSAQLAELDAKRKNDKLPGIRAVGVLGSDVYDKLLIFRALRPLLKDTLFFTNNLDAWLWEREELRTNRNLVVASPFGLSMGEYWQSGKPPFRDSYQTAVYAGVLALATHDDDLIRQLKLFQDKQSTWRPVRLYEIGRNGPVDLSFAPPDAIGGISLPRQRALHPDSTQATLFWSQTRRRPFLWIISGLVVCSWLIWFVASNLPYLRSMQKQGVRSETITEAGGRFCEWSKQGCASLVMNPAWIMVIVVVSSILCYRLWKMQLRRDEGYGEALAFFSGTSVWPYVACGLGATLLGAYLSARVLAIVWRCERGLKEGYFFNLGPAVRAEPAEPAFAIGGTWGMLLKFLTAFWHGEPALCRQFPRDNGLKIGSFVKYRLAHHLGRRARHWRHLCEGLFLLWKAPRIIRESGRDQHHLGGAGELQPKALWMAYRQSSKLGARVARSGFVTLLIWFGSSQLQAICYPDFIPARGHEPMQLCKAVGTMSLVSFIWLAALVFDELWLKRVFIEWFGRGQSVWPREVLRRYSPQRKNTSALCDYIDLNLIADWTRDMGRLTALPFYVLACLLLARLNIFDSWPLQWHLVLTYSFVVCLVILGAYRLHASAERLRQKALESLTCGNAGLTGNAEARDLEQRIKNLRHGAFTPFLRQPVMEAVYWLVSALSVTGLWQAISQMLG